jgi:hypothetical protein
MIGGAAEQTLVLAALALLFRAAARQPVNEVLTDSLGISGI